MNPARPMTPDDDRHGTTRGYAAGCKCRPCMDANSAAARARAAYKRRGLPDATLPAVGTIRRLRALVALGWTTEHLALELGVIRSAVNNLMLDRRGGLVRRSTHDAVCVVYDRLSMKPGPSALSRSRSAAKGWAPPLAWDDGDDLDDPNTKPQAWQRRGTVVDPAAARPWSKILPAVEDGRARGLSPQAIVDDLNTTLPALTRRAWRHRENALAAWLEADVRRSRAA